MKFVEIFGIFFSILSLIFIAFIAIASSFIGTKNRAIDDDESYLSK